MMTLNTYKSKAYDFVWGTDIAFMAWWKAWPLRLLRLFYVVGQDLAEGQLTLRAMSLVFTTLLSLVPLLAISFSILKGFGVHDQIETMLNAYLVPLGEQGQEITAHVIGFVENTKASVLGSLGLLLLIYTTISLLQKIEGAFNFAWRIQTPRSFARRFTDYLSVLLIGPVLVFTAMGITATLMNSAVVQWLIAYEFVGSLIHVIGKTLPYLFVIAAFTFIYTFIPNTRVQLNAAITGATVAGVLWQTTGWLFAKFMLASTTYTVIYSGFAILLLFMIWLYLSWLILLIGADIAFYHQNTEYLVAKRKMQTLSPDQQEQLAFLVMFLIAENYYQHRPPWKMIDLAKRLRVPMLSLVPVLKNLEDAGLIAESGDNPPSHLPTKPIEDMQLRDILTAIKQAHQGPYLNLPESPAMLGVGRLFDDLNAAVDGVIQRRTLKELVLSESTRANSEAADSPTAVRSDESVATAVGHDAGSAKLLKG